MAGNGFWRKSGGFRRSRVTFVEDSTSRGGGA